MVTLTLVGLSTIKDAATIVGVAIASFSLMVAAYNTRVTRRTNRASFWLDLRRMFSNHDRIHRLLRPAGEWASKKLGPTTSDEWAEVEAYLALFEICEDLLAQSLIDADTFRKGYAYRIENILANDSIRRQKLVTNGKYWERFLSLVKRMGFVVKD